MSKIYQLKLFQENQEQNNLRDSAEENSVSSATYLDKEHVINWVLERCIAKYFEMSLRANSKSLPSSTSRISDNSSSRSNEFFSKTEAAAIERVSAAEWLRIFHTNLDGLPVAHKQIIEQKYLQRAPDGRYRSDLVVYQELNVGRTVYYRMKKEALYWLGVTLIEEKIFEDSESVQKGD